MKITKTSEGIVSVPAEIRTGLLPNIRQKRYRLSQLGRVTNRTLSYILRTESTGRAFKNGPWGAREEKYGKK
jgi:hypothetical protein